ncbi:hypothetical protein NFI96_027656 [Prochilodus magdalenae]|nr:hypothetical protein NFI96_027656 [Prochilodus magdalenae]
MVYRSNFLLRMTYRLLLGLTALVLMNAIEMCESSSGLLSLSRCQLFEAGYAAEMLHLNDPMCKGKIQGDRVVFDFNNDNNTCGTTLTTNETHFIYENAVQHYSSGDVGVISRQKWLSVNFSCVYPLIKSISMPMVIEAAHGVVSSELSTEGSYTIRMMPYPNASYIEPYSGNVTLDENQQIFVAVDVEGVDGRQIALVIDSCWGTPINNTNSSLFWPLVSKECPNRQDGTVEVLQNGISTSSRFSFRMFTFTGQSENIYLHCKVHLCLHKESEGSCAHALVCTPGFGDFLPLLATDPLKISQIRLRPLVDSHFQVSPEMFEWVQVKALAGSLL